MIGHLTYLVGLPRSGKSRRAAEWQKEHDLTGNTRVVISGDAFRHAIHGKAFIPQAEGTVFAAMDIAIRALLNSGYDVLVDETSTSEATLLRYYRLDINATAIWIDTPKQVCIDRAIGGGKEYLVGPIERIDKQFCYLIANWDEITTRLKRYLSDRTIDDVEAS